MKKVFVLMIFILVLVGGCNQQVESPSGPALGDSFALTGTIANLNEADVTGKDLLLKAEILKNAEPKVMAEATVTATGVFTIILPGMTELENDLLEEDPSANCLSDTLTVTPTTYKGLNLRLVLYSDGQKVAEQLSYANGPLIGGQSEVSYQFVDRDVTLKGSCDTGLGLNSFDMELKKGWNSVILGGFPDTSSFGFRTAVPDASFTWQLPICQIGCP